MEIKELIDKYFEDFLNEEIRLGNNGYYYYSVRQWRKFNNGYYEIGVKNLEDLIYDEEGELKDESEEYDMIVERFVDYLYNNNVLDDKHYVEEIFNALIEKISIYCY